MSKVIGIRLTFDGPFNVGAGALGGTPADRPLTRDARGLPVVPASSFKGRLRHQVEQLAGLFYPGDRPPCGSPQAEAMCQGDDEPCPACRLFGSPWRPGKLTFSDLELVEPSFLVEAGSPPAGSLRYGVGLSRQRRVAEDKLLYTTEVVLPGTPLTLAGAIRGDLDEQELALLRAALDSLVAVGSAKTRGLGWFEMAVDVQDEPPPAPAPEVRPQDRQMEVIVTLQSPLLLGTDANEDYYNPTRSYIPGSVLRGSLARLLLAECRHGLGEPHDGCDFGRLFGGPAAPVFEHLYPTIGQDSPSSTPNLYALPFPAPLTARSCKYHPGFRQAQDKADQGHGVGDLLIRQAVFEEMLDRDLPMPALYKPRCPACGEDAEPYDSFLVMARPGRFDSVSVPIRRTSRTAINRQRAVAADGQLYTLEVVEPQDNQRRPTTFRGRVQAAPEQVAILSQWLPRLAAIGRKQSSGLGHVKVKVGRPGELDDPLPPLAERIEAFNRKYREERASYERDMGLEPLPADTCFFSLDLLSPAALSWRNLPVTGPTAEMLGLGGGVALQRAFAGHGLLGGWHLGAGLPRRTQPVVAEGSVFLYRCQGYSPRQLADRLGRLEIEGIGSDRARGLGRVLVCLSFHYQAEVMV